MPCWRSYDCDLLKGLASLYDFYVVELKEVEVRIEEYRTARKQACFSPPPPPSLASAQSEKKQVILQVAGAVLAGMHANWCVSLFLPRTAFLPALEESILSTSPGTSMPCTRSSSHSLKTKPGNG